MEIIFEFFKFSSGVIFSILIGISLISWLENKISARVLLIAFVLGIILVSIVSLFLSYFKVSFLLINFSLILFSCFMLFKFKPKFDMHIKILFFPLIFILVGAILMNNKLIFEGFVKDGGFLLAKGNVDALWHIALQESLKVSVPPENPLYFSQLLTGYHYLNDMYWSWFSKSFDISTINLVIFYAPLLISVLFVATTLLVMLKIFKEKKIVYIASSLVVFTSSLSFLAPLFFPLAGFHQSVFWLDQPTYYIFNQQLTLSIAIINLILFLFLSSYKKWWWLIGILIGSLAGVKVYGLLIIFPTILLIGFYLWRKKRDWNYIGMLLFSIVISVSIILIEGPSTGIPFYFDPGLLIRSMFSDPWRLAYPDWETHRQILTEQHDWIRLAYHWIKGLAIFLIGNFNLKILSLFFLPFLFRNKNLSKENKIILLFSMVIIILSFSAGLLLAQKAVSWNVVQFLVYAQLPLVVILVFCVIKFLSNKYQVIVLIFIIIFGVPSSLHPIKFHSNLNSYIYYSPGLLQMLQQVKILPPNSQIIVGKTYYTNSLFPAFSGRGVYLADINVLELLLPFSAKDRIEYISKLENRQIECKPNQYLISDVNKTYSLPDFNKFQFRVIYQRDKIYLLKCEKK